MTAVAERLKTTLAALSQQDRAELAHFLIQTLDDVQDDVSEQVWRAELDRRRNEVVSGRDAGIDVDEVITRTRGLLS